VEGAAAGCETDTLQGTSAMLGQSIARCARLADLAVMTHPERRNYFGQNIAQDMLVEGARFFWFHHRGSAVQLSTGL
jgi:hypothetical protein